MVAEEEVEEEVSKEEDSVVEVSEEEEVEGTKGVLVQVVEGGLKGEEEEVLDFLMRFWLG